MMLLWAVVYQRSARMDELTSKRSVARVMA